ncbi:CBR-DGN-1 protein [Aphelenchoides besseyi]|nr:CBR-DGN-1 protein [Aphelenchoides besseyi]KAI6200452.1 CBR-DGN-1 protein [Aphelenchoides besseyi]
MRFLNAISLLLVFLPLSFCEQQNVVIGQLFEFGLTNDRINQSNYLPNWIGFDSAESVIFGIPRWDQFMNTTLRTVNGLTVDIIVKVEDNLCNGKEYTFVEKYYEKDFDSYKIEDLRQLIKDFSDDFEIEADKVRAFSYSDLLKYRNETGDKMITPDTPPTLSQLVLWSKLECGSDMEESSDQLAKAADMKRLGEQLGVGQAIVLVQNVLALQTATPSSAMRTTRAIPNVGPILFSKINTFTCKRGILCHQWLPYNTFADSQGTTLVNLHPQVFSTGEHPNFLNVTIDNSRVALEGIGLKVGTYNFRLQVRDRSNNVANAPFDVVVEETPAANHVFEFLLDANIQKYRDQPALLATFAHRLSKTIGGRPTDILVQSLEEAGSQSLLKFSNNTLDRKSCQNAQIDEARYKMVGREKGHVLNSFRKAMGPDLHVKSIRVDLRDSCATSKASTISIGSFRASTTTLRPEADAQSGISNTLLIVLIAVVLLVLAAVACVLCFFLRKRSNVYKKANTEYSSKGHPVVFPDEMAAHDEEANNVVAGVSTPMLVANDQAPLQPGNTTTTQNPLYKPPSAGGTPIRNPTAAIGQRLPPPYTSAS